MFEHCSAVASDWAGYTLEFLILAGEPHRSILSRRGKPLCEPHKNPGEKS